MTNPNIWNQLFIWPIVNALALFYKFTEFLGLPGKLGFSIILMTIFIRIVLYPLTRAQLTSAKKMADIKPKIDELSKKHKNDKAALQQAQLALYKEHNINPASGCLPMLIQFPVLIALYNVFYQFFGAADIAKFLPELNKILYAPFLHFTSIDFSFFGVNLAWKPNQWQQYGWWMLLVPVITAGLQWYQTKLMMPQAQPTDDKALATKNSDKDKSVKTNDDMAQMQKQMAIISPLMFAWFSYGFPLGLALYWNIFGLFGIMQQIQVNRSSGGSSGEHGK